MRLFFSSLILLLGCLGLVQCKSAVGDRILVVLEDDGQRNAYSQFWADLECELYLPKTALSSESANEFHMQQEITS